MKKYNQLIILTVLLAVICVPGPVRCEERYAVSVPIANIRQGPGTNFDTIWRVEKYYPVRVLEKQGDWYRFEDYEGDQGWISKSILDQTRTVVVRRDQCNIRQGPGTDFPVVFQAQSGVPFKVIKTQGDWLNIEHADGDTGWVHRPLVW